MKKKNWDTGKIRSTPPPSSPGSATSKSVFNQAPSPNVSVSPNIPVGLQTTHGSMPHPVPLNMAMPPTGVVVHTTYNTPPPFVSPTTQASSAGTIYLFV